MFLQELDPKKRARLWTLHDYFIPNLQQLEEGDEAWARWDEWFVKEGRDAMSLGCWTFLEMIIIASCRIILVTRRMDWDNEKTNMTIDWFWPPSELVFSVSPVSSES